MAVAIINVQVRIPDDMDEDEAAAYLDEITVEVTDDKGIDIYQELVDYHII